MFNRFPSEIPTVDEINQCFESSRCDVLALALSFKYQYRGIETGNIRNYDPDQTQKIIDHRMIRKAMVEATKCAAAALLPVLIEKNDIWGA